MKNFKKMMVLGALFGVFMAVVVPVGSASAKVTVVTKTFGRTDSYNYNQCPNGTWISGWKSCTYGCGWTIIASAKSKLRGAGYSPKVLWKKVSLSTLNSGMSASTLKSYAGKVGLSARSIDKSAKSIASKIAEGGVVAVHKDHHWVLVYKAKSKFYYETKTKKYKYKSTDCFYVEDPGHSDIRGRCKAYSSSGVDDAILLK